MKGLNLKLSILRHKAFYDTGLIYLKSLRSVQFGTVKLPSKF